MPTVAFITLGCKVNQYETQLMRESLKKAGYRIIAPDEHADVYVINTCTVTNISDRKSRQMIRRAISLNPDARIVVTGCYAERQPDRIKNILCALAIASHRKGVDLVLPNSEKAFIGRYLNGSNGQCADADPYPCITGFDDQTRALVKIEDGCDSFCTYCIVPYVRGGAIRSRPLDSIIREVQCLAKNRHREVVLTGVHLGAYGRDMANGTSLADALRAVHAVDGIERIRLSSIEPMDVSDDLIYEMARLPKCAHHLHISLQSGSNRILRLMNRGYTSTEFENIVIKVRSAIPGAGISTDVMVGFPGETEQDFADTYDLISRVKFSRLHVFRYSPREGTPAAKFPDQVPDRISTRRSQEIISLGDRLAQEFRSRMLGQEAAVLIEDVREPAGFTSNYVRVLVLNAAGDLAGRLVRVKLVDMKNNCMIGLRA